jgi:hypothetical protein
MCVQSQEISAGDVSPSQKITDATVFIMYPSGTMKYTLAAAVNLLTLLIGIAIGLMLSPNMERSVAAQPAQPAGCVNSATVECVTPIMTVGSAGIGRLLSNQIAADQLTVNGYDVLKLDNNLLGIMVQKGAISPQDAQRIAESSHPDKLLRFQLPSPPAAPPGKTP